MKWKYFAVWTATIFLFGMFLGWGSKAEAKTSIRSTAKSSVVIRDADGFQKGFMDEAEAVQQKNSLDVQLTYKPDNEMSFGPVSLKKIFAFYRGYYDSIFDIRRDTYNEIRDTGEGEDEIGLEDIEYGNDMRELYMDLGGTNIGGLNLRLGKQIVTWGEADGFTLLDVINPSDYSDNMFFEDPEITKMPLWMGKANYQARPSMGAIKQVNLELLAIPDIRGTRYAPLDYSMQAPYAFSFKGMSGFDIIHNVPDATLEDFERGGRITLNFQNGLQTKFGYFRGVQDAPAITIGPSETAPAGLQAEFNHPWTETYGAEFNYYVQFIDAVFRGEGSLTKGGTITDTTSAKGYSEHDAYQALLGLDRNYTVPGIHDPVYLNLQVYWKHMDIDEDQAIYPGTLEDSYRITAATGTKFYQGRIEPSLLVMYDPEDNGTWMTSAKCRFRHRNDWFTEVKQISFWGDEDAVSPFADSIGNSELSFFVGKMF